MNSRMPLVFLLLLPCVFFCNRGKPATTNKQLAGPPAESCVNVEPAGALMRCNGNILQYCSSFSSFKWTEAQQCPAGKTCFVAPDGKGGGCR